MGLTAHGSLPGSTAADAQVRLAEEQRRAFTLVADASPDALGRQYDEARNILTQWLRREQVTIDSLRQIGDTPAARGAIARARQQLDGISAAGETGFHENAAAIAADRGQVLQEPPLAPDEKRLGAIVPKRNMQIRGPVNLFRPEYGAVWLAQKTGNDEFIREVKLTTRGQYVSYEALNFVDGKRSVLDIRDAISAEYGPVDLAEVEQYFRFLASVNVVSLDTSSGPPR